jgi:hypothetical protein
VDSVVATARDGDAVFVAADRYQDASQIAFHGTAAPTTFSLNLAGRRNQYDYWPAFPDVARHGDVLIVALDDVRPEGAGATMFVRADTAPHPHRVVAALAPHFSEVRPGPLVAGFGDPDHDRRRVWILEGWRGTWPGRR